MTAKTDAERSRAYRQRKKAKGEQLGQATRLGPFVSDVVEGLAQITGESRAEVVRVLVTQAIHNSYTDADNGMTLDDTLGVIRAAANPAAHLEQAAGLAALSGIIKSAFERDREILASLVSNQEGE